jgi:hypothetical protein
LSGKLTRFASRRCAFRRKLVVEDWRTEDCGDCKGCGAKLIPTGPPIWDTYCSTEGCKQAWNDMVAGMARAMAEQERQTYERLKAKFEPAQKAGE